MGIGSVFNARLIGEGYPPITIWAPAAALALNVGANLWLVPWLGLRGAALSTSLAYAVWGVLVTGYCLRRTGNGWSQILRPPSLGAILRSLSARPR
jgi:Na+-driven multidrug efflux pump